MASLHRIIGLLTVVAVSLPSLAADKLPIRALYKGTLPANAHSKLVKSVEIAADSASGQQGLYWYRITCNKVSGDSFKLWILTDGHLFSADVERNSDFLRYIIQEPGQSPVEYVNERSGMALPPMFDLREKLLPRATEQSVGLLFERGAFLGHPLIRGEILDGQPVLPPKDIIKLTLNPDLLIGTSRNFRDDGKGRKTEKENYNYIPFTEDNYDEMIAAGINYFTAQGEQIDWIKRRAVFYEGYSPQIDFPEELFRPNFKGLSMFID